MKKPFLILLTFLSFSCYGQYTLEIKSVKDCDIFSLIEDDTRDPDIKITDIKPLRNVAIKFEDDVKIKSIVFKQRKENGTVSKFAVPTLSLDASKFEIVNIGGDKMQWKSVGDVLYPYDIIFTDEDGNECHLILGDQSNIGQQATPKITSGVNLLEGIDESISTTSYDKAAICKMMGKSNALLLLDCSPFLSSDSKLLRKNNEECKFKKSLKVGDYLKVYLYNFNKYRYKVQVNNTFVDTEYGKSEIFPKTTAPSASEDVETSDDSPRAEAASTLDEKQKTLINNIVKMSTAQKQLKAFIDRTKSSTDPDSKNLDANKEKIKANIKALGIEPIGDREKEDFKKLNKATQGKYKIEYEQALAFESTYNQFELLSYTIEATILPILIKSFDKLNLTLTLSDAKTGNEVSSHDYTYLIAGGLKVDQSFGINFHGIKDREFSLRPFMENDTVYAFRSNGERLQLELDDGTFKDSIASITPGVRNEILESDTSRSYSIGLTTLTHIYYRLTGEFSIGPEIGISADLFPDTEVRYLAGLGVLFKDGRYRISLDVGYAFGKYQDFGGGQDFGHILKGQGVTPTLIEKSAIKPYIGISYNVPLGGTNATVQKANL